MGIYSCFHSASVIFDAAEIIAVVPFAAAHLVVKGEVAEFIDLVPGNTCLLEHGALLQAKVSNCCS